jgi:histidyl-tRNA synthetase
MRDIIGDKFYAYQGFFEKAAEIAIYYGFRPIETPILEKEGVFTSGVGNGSDIVRKEMYTLKTKGGDNLALRPEGTAGIMRAYIENGMQSLPQPLSFYYYGPYFRHEKPQRGRLRELRQFGLEILGTSKPIADATIIKLIWTALEEAGLKNLRLEVNSIGDSECRGAYRRDLVNYYKKHLKELCPDCRERLKTNPLRLLDCKDARCQDLKAGAPESVSYLCPSCKSHFKEVLEYLEGMGVPYTISPTLVRGLDYYTRTVFEIKSDSIPATDSSGGDTEEETPEPLTIAAGGRYDYLAKQLGSKKDIPGVGGAIGVDRVLDLPDCGHLATRLVKKPKIFFIQLSFDAKQKRFEIIETLRKAKVPVAHSLAKDSLGAQLGIAEKLGVPYTLILGQKEALDGTVIVRNMDNRSQDTIKIAKLADYLKKMK